jgi:hypothetical protein
MWVGFKKLADVHAEQVPVVKAVPAAGGSVQDQQSRTT